MRRPFSFGAPAHGTLAFALLALLVAFTWQPGIASLGDDSVSYLAIARWMAGAADASLAPWLSWHSHFPPMFPLLLAATGGATDGHVAHAVVAALGALGVGLAGRHAALRLGSEAWGLGVALQFALMPTLWIGSKGILSETLFLALTLAALLVHERRIARGAGTVGAFAAFGLLLAAAQSTRAIGVALVAAYAVHAAVKFFRGERRARVLLPFALVAAFVAAWVLARPPAHEYATTLASVLRTWRDHPATAATLAGLSLLEGWTASFTAEPHVPPVLRAAAAAAGVLALLGAARAALANRLDGWYVIASLGILLLWPFGTDTSLRLLLPLVPVALTQAAEVLQLLAARGRTGAGVAAVLAAGIALSCVPAAMLIATRAQDADPAGPGIRHAPREMTAYYRSIDVAAARAAAAQHAAVISGLEGLSRHTPDGARVMWLRPEYVAILGGREGVPFYVDWDARTLARRILEARVDYFIVAGLYKSDLAQAFKDPAFTRDWVKAYAKPEMRIMNPVTGGEEFALWRIDAQALRAYLARDAPA